MQVIGKNILGKEPKLVVKSTTYVCLYESSVTLSAKAGSGLLDIKRYDGRKSNKVTFKINFQNKMNILNSILDLKSWYSSKHSVKKALEFLPHLKRICSGLN